MAEQLVVDGKLQPMVGQDIDDPEKFISAGQYLEDAVIKNLPPEFQAKRFVNAQVIRDGSIVHVSQFQPGDLFQGWSSGIAVSHTDESLAKEAGFSGVLRLQTTASLGEALQKVELKEEEPVLSLDREQRDQIYLDMKNKAYLGSLDYLKPLERWAMGAGLEINEIGEQEHTVQEGLKAEPSVVSPSPSPVVEQQKEPHLFHTESIPVENVALPDALKEQLQPRIEIRPIVLREGSPMPVTEMKPDDTLVGYKVDGITDPLPGAKEPNANMFPALPFKQFGLDQLEEARTYARAKAAETVINFDTLESGFVNRTGKYFEFNYFPKGSKDLERWQEQKAQFQAQQKAAESPTVETDKQPESLAAKETPQPSQEEAAKAKAPEQSATNADLLQNWPDGQAAKAAPVEEKQQGFARLETPVPLVLHNKKPLVLDYGDHITVTNRAMFGIGREAQKRRDNAVGTALGAAVQRFGEPVHIVGNKAFVRQTAEMAVKLGIELQPGDKMAEKIYQEVQERAAREKGNVLSPARPTQSKSRTQDLGAER